MEFLLYPALGVVAGLAAGLLGVGGGLIIVPVLIYGFTGLGFAPESLTHMAVGTSLATIILTSSGSIYQHNKQGNVLWPVLRWFAFGLIIGALLGAKIADLINGRVLQIMFGVFAIVVAIQMVFGLRPKPSRGIPGKLGLVSAGVGIGSASAIFGIGGGSFSVPFLVWCNQEMKKAVGTSAAGGFPIAFAGALGFVITGWQNETLPSYSLGYVYLPALAGIAVTSIIFARVGAHWAHRLHPATLKKIFAILSVTIGIKLIIG